MLTTGAYPGGKHNDVAVGTESLFHHARKITRLRSGLVDRNTERSQTMQIHQQIVDQILDASVIMCTQQIPQCNAVLPTQRMVRYECTKSVFRQILQPMHIQLCIQKVHACSQKIHSTFILYTLQESVYLFLMHDMFQVRNKKRGIRLAFFQPSLSRFYQYLLKNRIASHYFILTFLCKCNLSFGMLLIYIEKM